jgi:ATP-dependent helicase/nuclease subunit B
LFAGLFDDTLPAPSLKARDYPDFYRSLIAGENVRATGTVHPRLNIWGPLEARLQQPDVVVLGSLNEGTWPEAADPGPWLNRPMRTALGLPLPEERIGHAAHDVTALLAAPAVFLTRALKSGGVPTVASRWLMRLKALAAGVGAEAALAPASPWLAWAAARDQAPTRPPSPPPAPRPPLAMRPRRLSVSAVESWIANPYAIFARHILELEPLPPLGAPPDAGVRGSVLHEVLARFTERHPTALPADPEHELVALIAVVLHDLKADARVTAFWLPRLERFAGWLARSEAGRRQQSLQVRAEVKGQMAIAATRGAFHLRARADRIDQTSDGLVITDFKTGRPPSDKMVKGGLAPQLPLEAAIAEAGGFADFAGGPVAGLRYIRATGGEVAGEERTLKVGDIAALARSTVAGLASLVTEFDRPETGYRAVRRPGFTYDYDDYAHLARAKEWAGADDGEAGGEP